MDKVRYSEKNGALNTVVEGDATKEAKWSVEDGTLMALGQRNDYIQYKPIKPGRTMLTVTYKGVTIQKPVVITDFESLLNGNTVVDLAVTLNDTEETEYELGDKSLRVDLKNGRTRQLEVIATLSNGEKINVSKHTSTSIDPEYIRVWDNMKSMKDKCVDDALTIEFLKPGKTMINLTFDGKGYLLHLEVVETRTHSTQFKRIFKFMIGSPIMNIYQEAYPIDPANSSVMPVIVDGRTLLPARALVENAGGTVEWDHADKRVTLKYKGREIVMWLDHHVAFVNGKPIELDVPPQLINARTFLPLRFIGENLGYKVDWYSSGLINLLED